VKCQSANYVAASLLHFCRAGDLGKIKNERAVALPNRKSETKEHGGLTTPGDHTLLTQHRWGSEEGLLPQPLTKF